VVFIDLKIAEGVVLKEAVILSGRPMLLTAAAVVVSSVNHF
jgi:hypothetical protein